MLLQFHKFVLRALLTNSRFHKLPLKLREPSPTPFLFRRRCGLENLLMQFSKLRKLSLRLAQVVIESSFRSLGLVRSRLIETLHFLFEFLDLILDSASSCSLTIATLIKVNELL